MWWGARSKTVWNWEWAWSARRGNIWSAIWLPLLVAACWFLWTKGYGVLALIILIAGVPAGIWLQWALWDAQLKPWAARSTMAVNDPVYDIPEDQDPDDVPSNPAADPLYDTDADLTEAPADPGLDPLARAPQDVEGTPPAASERLPAAGRHTGHPIGDGA